MPRYSRQQTNELTPALAPAPDRGGEEIPGPWAAAGSGILMRLCVEALRRGLVPHRGARREGGHLDVLDRSTCICCPSSIIYHLYSAPARVPGPDPGIISSTCLVRIAQALGSVGHTMVQQIYTLASQWKSTTKTIPHLLPLLHPPWPVTSDLSFSRAAESRRDATQYRAGRGWQPPSGRGERIYLSRLPVSIRTATRHGRSLLIG